MVSCIENREQDCQKPTFQDLKSQMNEKHAMINVVCNDSIHSSDFFQAHPECNRYLDLFAVGVHEKYQRRGIASKLVEKSIEVRKKIAIYTKKLNIYEIKKKIFKRKNNNTY